MKKQSIKLLVCTALIISATSCKKEKKVETTEAKPVVETVVATETYKTIAENTFVNWEAKKIVGGHQGTIHSSTGMLEVKGDKVVGGNIIIDLNTIKCTDIEDEATNAKLIGHLKNKDFFDVEQFANGAFQITSISEKEGKTMVAGNLTLKNIKKNIEFPASVSVLSLIHI